MLTAFIITAILANILMHVMFARYNRKTKHQEAEWHFEDRMSTLLFNDEMYRLSA